MGVVIIDQRARGAGVVEYDFKACKHCQASIKIPRRGRAEGRWCGRCGGHVCNQDRCQVCLPWKKQVDARWNAIHHSDAFARAAGLAGR